MWAGDVEEELEVDGDDDDQVDRLFTFEVTKTNEQEENVTSRPGIDVRRFLSTLVDAKVKVGRPINVVPSA